MLRAELLPAFVPAGLICEAPFNAVPPPITIAPIGLPVTQPGTIDRCCARKEVTRARKADSRRIQNCRRKDMLLLQADDLLAQRFERLGLADLMEGVSSALSSTVYTPNSVSLSEKVWSRRTVPKSSRMICSGWLNASAIPPPKSGPFCTGHSESSG